MAKIDTRKRIEGNLFAEFGPGGALMFSSGYFDCTGEDDKIQTELIISPEGIENLVDILAQRRLAMRAENAIKRFTLDGKSRCPECTAKYQHMSNCSLR